MDNLDCRVSRSVSPEDRGSPVADDVFGSLVVDEVSAQVRERTSTARGGGRAFSVTQPSLTIRVEKPVEPRAQGRPGKSVEQSSAPGVSVERPGNVPSSSSARQSSGKRGGASSSSEFYKRTRSKQGKFKSATKATAFSGVAMKPVWID